MNSVRCPVEEHLPPASIPTQADHPVRSSPTIPNVPMFLQDARDAMMFARVEMATKTNWTTLPIVLGTNHHPLEPPQDHHHLKCVTTSVTRMEVALWPMLDHQDLVKVLEAAFLMILVVAAQEHQMNVKTVIKFFLVLQKRRKNQFLIQDNQEVNFSKWNWNILILIILGKTTRHCDYKCNPAGTRGDRGCTVRYIGPNRPGKTSGSCFADSFGGSCSGTPPECQHCSQAIFCWSRRSYIHAFIHLFIFIYLYIFNSILESICC